MPLALRLEWHAVAQTQSKQRAGPPSDQPLNQVRAAGAVERAASNAGVQREGKQHFAAGGDGQKGVARVLPSPKPARDCSQKGPHAGESENVGHVWWPPPSQTRLCLAAHQRPHSDQSVAAAVHGSQRNVRWRWSARGLQHCTAAVSTWTARRHSLLTSVAQAAAAACDATSQSSAAAFGRGKARAEKH